MPRKARELSALAVQRLFVPGLHSVGGVDGLHLKITTAGAKAWILRIMIAGRRRDMGLGGYPTVSLAQAREFARDARVAVLRGTDPIAERMAARRALAAEHSGGITFREAVPKYIEAMSGKWRNAKHKAQWENTLETYACPVIGNLHPRDIGLPHIIGILEPIWMTKTETATRLRGRIESVLDWTAVRGYREKENPARWKGNLDKILPAPGKIAKREHHPAVPIAEMPEFMRELRQRKGYSARALELAVLTAARSIEVRGALWREFDLEERVWTVPAERMKRSKEHRVPLSDAAVELLRALPRIAENYFVFPSPKGEVMSDMSLTEVMRRMNRKEVPHGFRSTFRDWCSEHTEYSGEVAEMALSHAIKNRVEAAYRRGDLFEKRRALMEDWAKFIGDSVPNENRT